MNKSGSARRGALLGERKFEEARAGYGVVAVGRNFVEAERAVERLCFSHLRQCVEPHGAVANRSSGVDDSKGQGAAHAKAAISGANVEALHLADVVINFPEGNASRSCGRSRGDSL